MKAWTKINFIIFFFYVFIFPANLFAQEEVALSLSECIKKAIENNSDILITSLSKRNPETRVREKERAKNQRKKEEIVYKIKKLYYDLLLTKELIDLAEEVKNNFEKATEKAEKKLESEEPDITQQDVLKLKLGLVGSKDELNGLEHDRKAIIESLEYELGIPRHKKFDVKAKRLKQEKIEIKKIKAELDITLSDESSLKGKEAMFRITQVYLKINRGAESIKIAREARKVSRSLLVTNLANFDFGIGEAKDLFESLFIYMRSVKNYLTKIHDYNVAVADLSYETGKEFSNLVY